MADRENGASARDPADLLCGLQAIADHLQMSPRKVQYLADKGELPTFRLGKNVCATSSALAAHFAAKMQGAEAGQ